MALKHPYPHISKIQVSSSRKGAYMAAAGQDVANAPPPLRTMMERHLLPLVNHIKFKECLLAHSTCSSNAPATECWCRHALIEPEEQTDLPEWDHAAEVRAEYQCITPNHQCVSSFPAEPLWHVPAQARLSAMTGSIGSKHPSRQDAAGKDSPNRHSKVSLCPTPPHPTPPCPALPCLIQGEAGCCLAAFLST